MRIIMYKLSFKWLNSDVLTLFPNPDIYVGLTPLVNQIPRVPTEAPVTVPHFSLSQQKADDAPIL